MLKLSAKDFRTVIIKMFQQSITNSPEKMKISQSQQRNRNYKKGPNEKS